MSVAYDNCREAKLWCEVCAGAARAENMARELTEELEALGERMVLDPPSADDLDNECQRLAEIRFDLAMILARVKGEK